MPTILSNGALDRTLLRLMIGLAIGAWLLIVGDAAYDWVSQTTQNTRIARAEARLAIAEARLDRKRIELDAIERSLGLSASPCPLSSPAATPTTSR